MSRCPTGPVRYRDQTAAITALPIRRQKPEHVRECPTCRGWHTDEKPRTRS
ncbi:hypothetical protein [Streptomyces griseorubiginosus]|uniref:hypothetical protein n=1 Tax=Streptomyces griseorubiginosus TaxID=67304 RepID=UPI0033167C30